MLQFQNQKLLQKLETQKVEINALEDRLCQLRDKQSSYEKTLAVVDNSWKEVSNCGSMNSLGFLISVPLLMRKIVWFDLILRLWLDLVLVGSIFRWFN